MRGLENLGRLRRGGHSASSSSVRPLDLAPPEKSLGDVAFVRKCATSEDRLIRSLFQPGSCEADEAKYYSGALDGPSATGGRSLDTHLRGVPESAHSGFDGPRRRASGGHGTRQSRAGPHGRRSKAAKKLEERRLDQEIRQVGDAGTRVVETRCSTAKPGRMSSQDVTVRLRAAFRKAVRDPVSRKSA